MIKTLTKVGNSKAIVIDKSILTAAGIKDNTKFQITVNPNGGLIIQSIDSESGDQHKQNVEKVIKKHAKMFKRLADQ